MTIVEIANLVTAITTVLLRTVMQMEEAITITTGITKTQEKRINMNRRCVPPCMHTKKNVAIAVKGMRKGRPNRVPVLQLQVQVEGPLFHPTMTDTPHSKTSSFGSCLSQVSVDTLKAHFAYAMSMINTKPHLQQKTLSTLPSPSISNFLPNERIVI